MTVTGLRVCAHGVPSESWQLHVYGFQNTMSSGSLTAPKTTKTPEKNLVVEVKGEQTEALVGEKGFIIRSVHELTRTVIQRKSGAGTRLRLDIAGYAEKRKEALTTDMISSELVAS